jgi:membrane-associated protease RseP (regulator of RpoE activity)
MRRVIPAISTVLLLSAVSHAAEHKDDQGGERFAFKMMHRSRLGVEAMRISKEVRQTLGAPEDAGILVNRVEPESVAAEAAIKAGDVIVEVDGQKVASIRDIRRALADKEAGQIVAVVVVRDKKKTSLNAKMREKPSFPALGPEFSDMGERNFMVDRGGMRKDLEKLSQHLAELEKRLQTLESKR